MKYVPHYTPLGYSDGKDQPQDVPPRNKMAHVCNTKFRRLDPQSGWTLPIEPSYLQNKGCPSHKAGKLPTNTKTV